MASKLADPNVLFAVVMLRNGFVSDAQFAHVLEQWSKDSSRSVADWVVVNGWLEQDDTAAIDRLVQRQIKLHGNVLDSVRHHAHDATDAGLPEAHFSKATIQSLIDSVHASSGSLHDTHHSDNRSSSALTDATMSLASGTNKSGSAINHQEPRASSTNAEKFSTDVSMTYDSNAKDMEASLPGPELDDGSFVIKQAPASKGKNNSRFSVLRPHAKGGLGKVSVALDTELDREVALKEIRSTYADDESSRARFCLEACITGGLEHPGVVPVYGFGKDDDGSPYFAMRFIRGKTLKEAVLDYHRKFAGQDSAEQRLEFRNLLTRFVDTCNAIAYAHNRGVIHRDIKPSNIMLGKFGETLVVDWGLAKKVGREHHEEFDDEQSLVVRGGAISGTLDGSTVGTPTFMSPEQADGRMSDLKASSDIYSLGSTLYFILTGQTAFTGSSASQVVELVRENNFRPPSEVKKTIAPPLNAITRKAMSTQPEGRYSSALILANDIENWLADEPVAAYQENFIQRTGRWLRHHRTLATSIGVLALSLTTAAVVGMIMVNAEKNRTVAALDQVSAEKVKTEKALANLEMAQAETKSALAAETNARRQTRDVLNTVTDDLVGELLARNVELGKDDRAFFDRVLHQFSEFTSTENSSADSKSIRADGFMRVGNLQRRLDDLEAAQDAYQSAEEIWAELISASSDTAETVSYRADLAQVKANYGFLLAQLGKHKEAIAKEKQGAKLLEQLVDENPHDNGYRLQLAKLLGNRGNAHARLREHQAAEADYHQAIDFLEKLVTNDSSKELQGIYSQSLSNLASFYSRQKGKLKDAEQLFSKSIEALTSLTPSTEGDAKLERQIAQERQNLANVLFTQKRSDEAIELFESAIESQVGLTNKYPALALYRRDLVRSRAGLGRTLSSLGLNGAESQLLEAKSISDELVKVFPERVEFQKELAAIHDDLGKFYRRSDAAKAKRMYQRGLKVREKIETLDQNEIYADQAMASAINYANFLRMSKELDEAVETYETVLKKLDAREDPPANLLRASLFGLGDSCVKSQRYPQALECWTRLVANDQDPAWRIFELQRAICSVRVGEISDGISSAEDMLKEVADPEAKKGLLYYDIACCYAVAAKIETDETQSEVYAVRSIELLQNAGDEEFFDAKMRAHAASDVDLEILRGREDFKELCEEFDIAIDG